MAQPGEVVIVVECGGAFADLSIHEEGRAVGGRKHGAAAADRDTALGIARVEGELFGDAFDRVHDLRLGEVDAPCFDPDAVLFEDGQRIRLGKRDAHLFQHLHAGEMNLFQVLAG